MDGPSTMLSSAHEEDCCRVCRSEGTPQDPLFYPCKCSGSIRYVHQDCLMEWLNHSHKKHCELCKTPFQFTNLYDPAMPSRLPVRQMMRKLIRDIWETFCLFLRWTLVSFVWLAWLPYCTRHIWRSTVRMGDRLSSNSAGHLHALVNVSASIPSNVSISTTNLNSTHEVLASFLPQALTHTTSSAALNKVITEILEGQLITSIIVIVLAVVFLIREWIVQNNANLLEESPDFLLQQMRPPVDEDRRRLMQLEATPPSQQDSPTLDDLNQLDQVDISPELPSASTMPRDLDATLELGSVDHGDRILQADSSEVSTSTGSSNSSSWDNLRAQARKNKGRESVSDTLPGRGTSSNGSNEDLMMSSDNSLSAESALTTAELRALRRTAVLRATTQRVGLSVNDTRAAPVAAGTYDLSERQRRSHELDTLLARQEGLDDPSEARKRHARQRGIERALWEDAGMDEYPDSPMPGPVSDESVPEMLELPRAVSPLFRSEHNMRFSDNTERFTREVEIAATSANPRKQTYAERFQALTSDLLIQENDAEAPELSTSQLQILLDQIEEAPSPKDRTLAANAAVQVCIDVARLRQPDGPMARDDPIYREVMKQVGSIASTATRFGIEGAVDVQKAFRLAEGSPTEEVAASSVMAQVEVAQDIQQVDPELHGALDAAELNADVLRDELLEDDIHGLLVVIGIRGPLIDLLQSSMLVIVMVTSFIMFGICLPHICGQFVLTTAKNPRVYLLEMPIRVASVVLDQLLAATKTILNGIQFIIKILARYSRFMKYTYALFQKCTLYTTTQYQDMFSQAAQRYALMDFSVLHGPLSTGEDVSARVFAYLASTTISKGLRQSGLHVPDRLVGVTSGYCSLTLLGIIYVKANQPLTNGAQGRQIELALRSVLRQAGYVMKFIVILGIELVVFPFYCGLLLNVAFAPFLPRSTLLDRLLFFAQFPFTSLFLHWLVGNVYMFNFALFVSMCRDIVRPGLLYFIRDPKDPTFNPIKDILERPVRNQLRKIGTSVVMYGALILVAFGGIVWAVAHSVERILPLNWSTSHPLFELPFDLLSFQIILPLTFRYLKPHKKIKEIWKVWFAQTSHMLRLSSFIMGERVPQEEGHMAGRESLLAQLWFKDPICTDPAFVRDGSFRRVPATDSLQMRHGKAMIMVVTEDNLLLDPKEEPDETKNSDDYTVVYAPPRLQLRMYLFMLSMWAFSGLLCVSCSVLPLVTGRYIFKAISPRAQMHDFFAYLYGIYALGFGLWVVLKLGNILDLCRRVLAHCQKVIDHPSGTLDTVRKAATLGAKWLYLLSTLSILIPMLLGIALELYIIVPMGIWLDPAYVPTIHLVHDWVVGLVYVKIIGRTAMMMPANFLGQALNEVMLNDWRTGWRNPNLDVATRKLIAPLLGALLAALVMPLNIGALARWTVYYEAPKEIGVLIYRMSYPAALISGALVLGLRYALGLAVRWRATVRDALYLKGRQLHNFGESKPPSMPSLTETSEQLPEARATMIAGVLEDLMDAVEADERDVTI